ncbi:L-lactate dehydrogenase [Patellaria atrata CBS 101060]|uniref:L-lactate dehydrogenase n=1 Tax=Patellaria atrata CBS 101060 TaxID=1346257 RepID=A0A9P4SBP0_9PEZI|nr:L-lactate dehydrogenase [Patellaria atrata CBS 101060]
MTSDSKPHTSIDQDYTTPSPTAPASYQRDLYSNIRAPLFSTSPSEWERLAAKAVPAANYGYVFGSASSGSTHRFNREAFDRYRLRPRMLVNATRRDIHVNLFGTRYETPLIAAPVGVQKIMHEDGEEATARACRELKIPMVLSTAATRTIEEVAKANKEGDRWYQLYWPRPQDEEITVSLLNRARQNGYKVLVVTLDTFLLAWRPTDLDTAYLPFLWGDGCQIGFSDPAFNRRYEEELKEDTRSIGEKLKEACNLIMRPGNIYGAAKILANVSTLRKSQAWLRALNSGTYREWEHLKILKKHWDGPIVLKGIQTVEDAHKAIDYGMDGIIVSNHGGRQCDGAIASLDALAEIGADERVKNSSVTLLFDSGIRTGSDVLKALALGAKAVLIGRPYMYGLAISGEDGVKHVFRCILSDMDNMLANAGKTSLSDLSRDDLQVIPWHQSAKL